MERCNDVSSPSLWADERVLVLVLVLSTDARARPYHVIMSFPRCACLRQAEKWPLFTEPCFSLVWCFFFVFFVGRSDARRDAHKVSGKASGKTSGKAMQSYTCTCTYFGDVFCPGCVGLEAVEAWRAAFVQESSFSQGHYFKTPGGVFLHLCLCLNSTSTLLISYSRV